MPPARCTLLALTSLAAALALPLPAATPKPAEPSPWADWVEPDFPFISSVVDARRAGPGLPANNLTPRGLLLRAATDLWVAYDLDLLRVAAIWQGPGVTPKSLAPGSYHQADRKTAIGQAELAEPAGPVWLANGIYPGWSHAPTPALSDPRPPTPSPEEVGRGPLPANEARFQRVERIGRSAVISYTVGSTVVREWVAATAGAVERHLEVAPHPESLTLIAGFASPGTTVALTASDPAAATLSPQDVALPGTPRQPSSPGRLHLVQLPARAEPVRLCLTIARPAAAPAGPATTTPQGTPATLWPAAVTTRIQRAPDTAAYVVDEVPLPTTNPWRRNVRPADIQFLPDGTGVAVTLDGDVWLVRGLDSPGGEATWRRFASGLHEPMTAAIREGQVYVFDKNGIWRLRDTNGDGEADVQELFSNAFGQTADSREFPSTLRLAPGGEFVIAKGGQQGTTEGRHNGTVLRVSADGSRATVLGYGFRQPNLGVNLRTGLITASDQQGHYVPTTPLHIVRDGRFHGFLSPMAPPEKYPAPIADPLTWIPHPVNASALSQVWLFDAKMGPLNDALVHIGFNRPELFRVILNERASVPQAAVVSITQAFPFPPLNGSVHPRDGQLYLAGFQVLGWGNTSSRLAGLGRVRYTGQTPVLPREVAAMRDGILLRFDVPLDRPRAAEAASYSVSSWHYVRTSKYGSPQLKADGKPGVDWMPASAAFVSRDGRAVFVAVPGMKPVMQMRIGWSLATAAGQRFEDNAYFTPYELTGFDPRAEGFDDLSPAALAAGARPSPAAAVAATPAATITVEEGARLAQLFGCAACHSIEPVPTVVKIGPSWRGLYLRKRTFPKLGEIVADDAYLRESILEPTAKIAPGYDRGEAGMPSYAGVLNDAQIEALLLYLKSLR